MMITDETEQLRKQFPFVEDVIATVRDLRPLWPIADINSLTGTRIVVRAKNPDANTIYLQGNAAGIDGDPLLEVGEDRLAKQANYAFRVNSKLKLELPYESWISCEDRHFLSRILEFKGKITEISYIVWATLRIEYDRFKGNPVGRTLELLVYDWSKDKISDGEVFGSDPLSQLRSKVTITSDLIHQGCLGSSSELFLQLLGHFSEMGERFLDEVWNQGMMSTAYGFNGSRVSAGIYGGIEVSASTSTRAGIMSVRLVSGSDQLELIGNNGSDPGLGYLDSNVTLPQARNMVRLVCEGWSKDPKAIKV